MSKKKQPNEHIQVFVRCRPLLKSELNVPVPVEVHPEVNKILLRDIGTDKCTVKTFSFDKVFGPEAKQADIYAEVVAPIVQEVIMGFNCTIFAYGQTGTGKTFTIEGGRTTNLEDRSEDPLSGIIPRSMKHLFDELTTQNSKFEICVSFLELYNEEIFDLLSKSDDPVKLRIFDNSTQKGSVIVQGLEVRAVTSMAEVCVILDKGCKKRRKASTSLNKASSRSHTIFTVIVNLKESSSTLQKVKTGKLNLVDLAGSENIGRSGAIDKRAREAGNINQSLLALGRVITSLWEKAGHIPYRESKLTRLLQDSLGGQTKTAVIATISPSAVHIDETINTLEYALRAKSITNKPELNTQVTITSLTKDYLEEINRLKKGICELGAEKGFHVPEENLRHWKSTLASKREEKYTILSKIENLKEENKSLDTAILEANNGLTKTRTRLEEAKLRCEEDRLHLKKEKEDHKLHEAMLQLMLPLYDHLHEKLHKDLEEKLEIESEIMKKKETLNSAIEEQRSVREKFQNVRDSRSIRNEQLRQNAENISYNIKNMHDKVNSLASECNNYMDMLKTGFETTSTICENEFVNLFKAVSDLESINKAFQENVESAFHEEKSTKLKWIDEFQEAYLGSNESTILEPLHKTLNECESSLLGISSAINDLKKDLSSELDSRQNLMKEYLDGQNSTLESVTDCVNTLLNKQKENLEAYNSIVNECINSETTKKRLWNDRFQELEQALSSLDLHCTEYIKNEVDKSTQAHAFLRNSSRFGSEIAEKLTAYCESSIKNIDAVQKNIYFPEVNVSANKWKEMNKRMDASCSRYKDLNSELASCSSMSQDVEVRCHGIEDPLKNKFKNLDQPTASTCTQEMSNSILKCGDFYKSFLLKNQIEVDVLMSNDMIQLEKLTESSKQLSDSVNTKVFGYIQCIETDLLRSLTTDEVAEINNNRTEGIAIETTLFDQDITITTSDCVEEATRGIECPVCSNKATNETLHTGANDSPTTATAVCSKNTSKSPLKVSQIQEASGSKSFMFNFPRSPIRRPRSKNALPVRKNLQFIDVEKLTYQLLESSSDEGEL